MAAAPMDFLSDFLGPKPFAPVDPLFVPSVLDDCLVPTGEYAAQSPLSLGCELQAEIERDLGGHGPFPPRPAFFRSASTDSGVATSPPFDLPPSSPAGSASSGGAFNFDDDVASSTHSDADVPSTTNNCPAPGSPPPRTRATRALPQRRSRANRKPVIDDGSDSDDLTAAMVRKRSSKSGTSKRRNSRKPEHRRRKAPATTPSSASAAAIAAAAAAVAAAGGSPQETLEAMRLEKNRQSARECRLRKKKYIQGLESRLRHYEEMDEQRDAELHQAQAQLAALQAKYNRLLASQ